MKDNIKKNREPIQQKMVFCVMHRDGFCCRYCGSKPGSELLEIDHLIPVSFGGSDNTENLVTACKRCNRAKSNNIYFPGDLVEGVCPLDSDWRIHRSFGAWSIKIHPKNAVIESSWGYWLDLPRVFETDWEQHIQEKGLWREDKQHSFWDFVDCLNYARCLMSKDRVEMTRLRRNKIVITN